MGVLTVTKVAFYVGFVSQQQLAARVSMTRLSALLSMKSEGFEGGGLRVGGWWSRGGTNTWRSIKRCLKKKKKKKNQKNQQRRQHLFMDKFRVWLF